MCYNPCNYCYKLVTKFCSEVGYMAKQIVSLLLTILMIAGMTPVVFASAEPEVSETVVLEEATTEEAPAVEEGTAESAEMLSEEPAGEEDVVTAETSSDSYMEQQDFVYVLPSGEEIQVDPEDPLYAEKMHNEQMLLSAWDEITTYKSFTPREVEGEIVRPGIDVSSWQGTIDWEAVADAGVEFVFIRGAYRGTSTGKLGTDGRFEEYLRKASDAGLKVGVYIYSQAITEKEAREEAEYLLKLLDGRAVELPLVIDYEYYGYGGRLYNAKLTDRQRTDICLAFCETVENAGYDAMVYGNASMLSDDMYAGELDKVWLAHYTKKTGYKGDYDFWQCSAGGKISGISGNVDLNFWFDAEPEPEPVSGPFEDVLEEHWFYDTVMAAYENGVVSGMGESVFAPYDKALRGQVVTMLHRLVGTPDVATNAGFTDLTADYYMDAINWAAEQGIVQGYSETEFDPDGFITRQDLVTILYRMAGNPSVSGDLSGYSDAADVREYAEKAMIWAVEKGILNGYEDGTLLPLENAARAEVCAILMRYIDLAE